MRYILLSLTIALLATSTVSNGPPSPPNVSVSSPLLSPKSKEFKASLGTTMSKFVPAVPLPQPLSISLNGDLVTLNWTIGTNVQVQSSADFVAWENVGVPTTLKTATFPANGPIQYYRLMEVSSVTPGTCSFQQSFGGTNANGSATTKSSAVDSQGNLVIVGLMYYGVDLGAGVINSYGGQDAFIAKFSPDGTCLWSKHYGGVSNDSANGVAIDSADNIVVIGTFSGPPFGGTLDFGLGPMQFHGGSDVFVVKFSPDGAPIWSNLYGGTGSDQGISVALDVMDLIFITGTYGFFGTGIDFGGGALPTYGQQDVFLAKLSANDTYIWSKGFGGPDTDLVTSIAVDMVTPVICGQFRGTANFGTGSITSAGDTDAYVARYDATIGAAEWVKAFGDTRSQSANGVALDSSGNCFVCGDFLGTIDFGGGPVPADTGGSIYTVSYTPTGAFRWQQHFGSPDNGPHAAGMVYDAAGPMMLGEMVTGIDFGTGWLLGQGGNDAMLVQYNPAGNVTWAVRGGPFGDRATTGTSHGANLTINGDNGSQIVDFGCTIRRVTPGTINNGYWTRFNP